MVKRLVVSADDFGRDLSVNEAVETAHRRGVLTSTSLMVGAPATADAVERARRLPGLRVGLHLALVSATPVLPPEEVPALVGTDGVFRTNLLGAGMAYFFSPPAREQLRREIRAQFDAFGATGLTLDHANTHRHLHLHPVVAEQMIEIGSTAGLSAVRLPAEPLEPLRRADPGGPRPRALSRIVMRPWVGRLRRRLRAAGLTCNDRVFGIAWSGRMTEERVLGLLPCLGEGTTEIYFHPRTEDAPPGAGHGSAAELATLTSERIRSEIERCGIELTSFGELSGRG